MYTYVPCSKRYVLVCTCMYRSVYQCIEIYHFVLSCTTIYHDIPVLVHTSTYEYVFWLKVRTCTYKYMRRCLGTSFDILVRPNICKDVGEHSIWSDKSVRTRTYRYVQGVMIPDVYPISGTIFCDTISGHTRYWVTRYRVIPDIRYTRYRVCPDIGTDIHDQDIPISGPYVPILCQ